MIKTSSRKVPIRKPPPAIQSRGRRTGRALISAARPISLPRRDLLLCRRPDPRAAPPKARRQLGMRAASPTRAGQTAPASTRAADRLADRAMQGLGALFLSKGLLRIDIRT